MIPVSRPALDHTELESLEECLRSGWVSQGPYVTRFEEAWAAQCGRAHGVAVSNGTAALELAVAALGLPRGSEIIVPSLTIMSCALAVLYNHFTPVFVDVDERTWCLDPVQVRRAITAQTKAIMIVHSYGMPCDMAALNAVAVEHGLAIIEDAAQAHCSLYQAPGQKAAQRCGSFGIMSCFSFYANKLITTGEGGMVLTDSPALDGWLRDHANLCFGAGPQRFVHTGLGHNYRLSNLQAAVGCAQINKAQQLFLHRQHINANYRRLLSGLNSIKWQGAPTGALSNYWMNGLILTNGMTNVEVIAGLARRGIESRPFFHPLHQQQALKGRYRYLPCPVAERLAQTGLYLPSGAGITDVEIEAASAALIDVLGQ